MVTMNRNKVVIVGTGQVGATAAIGMDLDAALKTGTLPGEWISPYYELDDEGVLELVNELLPVYTQPITEDILNIRHR